jgi:hypothetical protein
MTELTPLDVLADLLAEDPFDLVDTDGGARLIIERLNDAGFEIVPTTQEDRA